MVMTMMAKKKRAKQCADSTFKDGVISHKANVGSNTPNRAHFMQITNIVSLEISASLPTSRKRTVGGKDKKRDL